MSVVILFKHQDGESTELLLIEKSIIGRSSRADLVLKDIKISGIHCSLEMTKDGLVLFTDLESTNGSFLENSQITSHYLRTDEVIKIGNTSVSIDDKRLSMIERLAIGKGKDKKPTPKNNDVTLPNELTRRDMIIKMASKEKAKKVLPKKPSSVSSDNFFERDKQDENSKSLEIDKNKKKKK